MRTTIGLLLTDIAFLDHITTMPFLRSAVMITNETSVSKTYSSVLIPF